MDRLHPLPEFSEVILFFFTVLPQIMPALKESPPEHALVPHCTKKDDELQAVISYQKYLFPIDSPS
jgi:hypothetical protein